MGGQRMIRPKLVLVSPLPASDQTTALYDDAMGVVERERRAARAELTAAVAKEAKARAEKLAAINRCREADLSITEIAALVGVTRETIYRWVGVKVR